MRRRLIMLFAAVATLGVVLALAVPRPEPPDDPTPRTLATAPTGSHPQAAVKGTLPRDKVVRARVGDLIELSVTSDRPDSATIEAFGLTEGTDPGAPARFSFLADRPGSFEVTLQLTEGKRVGRILVRR